ncbi:hypothetical protein QJS10_CPA01g00102 [Acorus calamus]|uniref:FACT complex subunit n=1 Tax=Acorus calamus TaxID=4465 RepID=A0AAV9FIU0_ACOCL|nr:hypothetical protein QJS10_CPA01g00102 [Acorus calamus]
MEEINGDSKKFKKNVRSFYAHWAAAAWSDLDAVIVSTSPVSPFSRGRHLSSAFLRWLVGSDLPGTTAIFTSSGIHFFCPPDQAAFIRGLRFSAADAVYDVVVVHRKVKAVSDAQGTRLLEDVLCDVLVGLPSAAEGDLKPIIVGCVGKEGPYERGSEERSMKVREVEIVLRDVTDDLSEFLEEETPEAAEVGGGGGLKGEIVEVGAVDGLREETVKGEDESEMDDEYVFVDVDEIVYDEDFEVLDLGVCSFFGKVDF